MTRRSVRMTWASLTVALVIPAGADAATQLGQTAAPNEVCGDVITWIQTASSVNYVVPPEGGVITAWSHRAGASASSVKLKVVRQANSAIQFTTVGTSALKNVPANALGTFPAQVRVDGGDILGLYTNTKQMPCGSTAPALTDTVLRTSGDVVIGANHTYGNTRHIQLDVAATVEPDRDFDGLGDESQDPTPPPAPPTPPGGGGGGTGGGGGPGQEQPPPAAPPRLDVLQVSPSVFTAANLGRSVFARVGARVTYVLSEAATVTFRVERRLAGRRVRGRCVRPTRANRRRAQCARYALRRGSFTHFGTTIVNRFTFTGRIGGRALPAGRYRLVARAANVAGAKSKVVRAPFRVVRARGLHDHGVRDRARARPPLKVIKYFGP